MVRIFGWSFTWSTGWLDDWHSGMIFGCIITETSTCIPLGMDLGNTLVSIIESPHSGAVLGSLVVSMDLTIPGNKTGSLHVSSVGISPIALVVNWTAYLLGIFTGSLMGDTIGLRFASEVNMH